MFTRLRDFLNEASTPASVLKAKYYKDVPDGDYDKIVSADPTSNLERDHMGRYSKWLLKLYKNKALRLEDLYKATEYLKVFDKHKAEAAKHMDTVMTAAGVRKDWRNVDNYDSLANLFQAIEPIVSRPEDYATGGDLERKAKTGTRKLHEDDEWLVVVPNSVEAACYYGKGTQWCTASYDPDEEDPYSRNQFDYYNRDGNLYIFISKKRKDSQGRNMKWQLHLESGQFMDVRDDSASVSEVPESLFVKCVLDEYPNNEDIRKLIDAVGRSGKDMDWETKRELVELTYPDRSNTRGDYISKDTVLEIMDGTESFEIGYWPDLDDIFNYYINDKHLALIKKAMAEEDPERADEVAAMDKDDVESSLDEFDDTDHNLRTSYRYASETAWYNDFYRALDRALSKVTLGYALARRFNLEDDDREERDFMVSEPHYGFDQSPDQKDFDVYFQENFGKFEGGED